MVFVRTWLRGLVGASGATLLVPLGLVLAVTVAATVGGTGLGEIGQVFRGPALPAGQLVAERGPGDAGGNGPTTTVPSIPARSTSRSRAGGGDVRGSSRTAPAGAPRRAVQAPSASTPSQRPARLPAPKRKQAPATTPTATGTTPPPPPPPEDEGPVRRVGGTVQDSVKPVPVVGPAASDAVETVVDLISPPPPPTATPPATPTTPPVAPTTVPVAPTGG